MPQPEAIVRKNILDFLKLMSLLKFGCLQTVRVQSRDGTKRIDIGPSDSIGNLLKKVCG